MIESMENSTYFLNPPHENTLWEKTQCGFTARLSQVKAVNSNVMKIFKMSFSDILNGFVPYTAGTNGIISWEYVMPSGVVYTILNDE